MERLRQELLTQVKDFFTFMGKITYTLSELTKENKTKSDFSFDKIAFQKYLEQKTSEKRIQKIFSNYFKVILDDEFQEYLTNNKREVYVFLLRMH